jgi:CrcB protein
MQTDYPAPYAFAQIALRIYCRGHPKCVRWLRKREGDGVRLNRPKGLMTPDRRAALRSFFLAQWPVRTGATMRITLLILFGAAGTLARYGLQGFVQHRAGSSFPTGTLIVNIVGCLLLGGVTQFGLHHLSLSPDWRIGLSVGFLGAFTTFSTFGLETVRLLEDGEWMRAVLYASGSIIGGMLAIVGGMRIADLI